MYDCINSAYCINSYCDRSCPTLAEFSYLLDLNNLDMNNPIFQASDESVGLANDILDRCYGHAGVWVSAGNPEGTADLITYCAICNYGKGSRLHCVVYRLNFSEYIEMIRDSWKVSNKPQSLEYVDIWIHKCNVLIISGIRYMKFNDFECQTLLKLIENRSSKSKTTLIISPEISSIIGTNSVFLSLLKSELGRLLIK